MAESDHTTGRARVLRALVLVAILAPAVSAWGDAAPVGSQNLADLIGQSDLILMGTVDQVSDGFNGQRIPYTEVTLDISEALRGAERGSYRFRQFGLRESLAVEGGPDHLALSPPGFPRWSSGEEVLLFLQQPDRLTGLLTTVGLSQGKLNVVAGRFERRNGVDGLFDNLVVEADGLTPDQIEMLRGCAPAVDAGPLLALLRRALDERWVETGVMRRAEVGQSAQATSPTSH
jgi:hypothetical protein